MNMNLIMQILKSGNPMQSIMNMMTPQQKIMAQTFGYWRITGIAYFPRS